MTLTMERRDDRMNGRRHTRNDEMDYEDRCICIYIELELMLYTYVDRYRDI